MRFARGLFYWVSLRLTLTDSSVGLVSLIIGTIGFVCAYFGFSNIKIG